MLGCFGDTASERSNTERVRLCYMAENAVSNLGSLSIFGFIKKRFLDLNKNLKDKELTYDYCSELVTYYSSKSMKQ
jgi:hypothetical protein